MQRIGIVGAGRFGATLAEGVVAGGGEVIVLDRNHTVVQRLASAVGKAVQGDATDAEVIAQSGLADCDTVVVAIGDNMEGSVLACMNLMEAGIEEIIAKAVSEIHGKVLERIGVSQVVYPDKERAERLARSLLSPSLLDYFQLSAGLSVAEVAAPKALHGKTLADSRIRNKYRVTVMAIKRSAEDSTPLIPTGEDVILSGDRLLVCGDEQSLLELSR